MPRDSQSSEDRRLIVRTLQKGDYEAIVDIQRRCFPTLTPWSRKHLKSHLRLFPEGQIGVELDGRLVATSSSMIVELSDYPTLHTYEQLIGDGLLLNHDPDGDTLYGLDIAVDPDFQGLRLARRIYDKRKRLARKYNLRRITFGGRMPGYQDHRDDLSAHEYVDRVVAKELRDPVITAQLSNGFTIREVLPNYIPTDEASCGYGVLMSWNNPDYRPPQGRRPAKIRVASVQYRFRAVNSFEVFSQQVRFFIETASEYRSDFVCFPELLTNQLQGLVPAGRPAKTARRLHEFTDRYIDFFSDMAIRYAVNVIGGSHLMVEDDKLYNVAYLFHRDGRIDRQYKIHITPAEERWWGVAPGHHIQAFDTDRGRIGIVICYDIEFPEVARTLRAQGARVLFVPYNTDIRSGHIRVRTCAQARCIENHIYVVTSGACGNMPLIESSDIHYAQSAILTPSDVHFARDAIAEEATANVEMMLVHDLDLDVLRRTERTGTVRPWIDRRTDLYDVKYKPRKAEKKAEKASKKPRIVPRMPGPIAGAEAPAISSVTGKTTAKAKALAGARPKKVAAKTAAAKKPATKKAGAKKAATKKAGAKKTTAKKPAAKKTTAKKPASKKTAAKKPAAKKPAAKKAGAKKPKTR